MGSDRGKAGSALKQAEALIASTMALTTECRESKKCMQAYKLQSLLVEKMLPLVERGLADEVYPLQKKFLSIDGL